MVPVEVLFGASPPRFGGLHNIVCHEMIAIWRETLEGSNIGGFGEKPSIRQFLNHKFFI